jgi:hypothetical protein
MLPRLALLAGLAGLGLLATSAAGLAEPLSEKAALAKAVDILRGSPYGEDGATVLANIRDRRLGERRGTVCGGGATKVWAFHVVVEHPETNPDGRIDGWLVIDAERGRLVCANLPFLD